VTFTGAIEPEFLRELHSARLSTGTRRPCFRREPRLMFDGKNERAKKFSESYRRLRPQRALVWLSSFVKQFVEALVCGKSYILVDFLA